MNILLVYPEFPDTFWSFKHALSFIHKKASSPPLGLLTVAAMLPSQWNKRLVDLNVRRLADKDLAWADYVFISAMVVQRDSACQVIQRCKQADVKVVAGGPLFSCRVEAFDEVDYLVLDEAEITLPHFIEDLENGSPKHLYSAGEFPDLCETPAPLWELADLNRYDSVTIQFSRGCPYNCDFCNVTQLFGHRPRTKSAAQLTAELDKLYGLGWRKNIFFVDDNFIGNKKQIKAEILPALIEWRMGKSGVPFQTEVTINLADDDELLQGMVEAGFYAVFIGIETPNEQSLAECGKLQNTHHDLAYSVQKIQAAGIQVQGGFIVGFDSDTSSVFQQMVDFIQKTGIVTAMVGLLQAPPGPRLYQRLAREGRVLDDMSGDNTDGTTNIIPKMGLDVLKSSYRRLLDQLYAPKPFYERARVFLQNYKPPKIKSPLEFQYILAFFRSIYRLGMKGVERVYYWRLLFWTLFHRPSLFPLAVTLTIYGYHFRKVVELHVQ